MIEQESHISNLPLRFGTSWIHHVEDMRGAPSTPALEDQKGKSK